MGLLLLERCDSGFDPAPGHSQDERVLIVREWYYEALSEEQGKIYVLPEDAATRSEKIELLRLYLS